MILVLAYFQNGTFDSDYGNRIRAWLFIGFVLGFSSIIAATWIMIADFQIIDGKDTDWKYFQLA